VVDGRVDVAFALELVDDRVVARKEEGSVLGEQHVFRVAVEARLDRPVDLAELPEPLELRRHQDSGDRLFVIHGGP
jgi:hypothetical protein